MGNAISGGHEPISMKVYALFILILLFSSWGVRLCTVEADVTNDQPVSYNMEPLTPFRIGGGDEYVTAVRNDNGVMVYRMNLVRDDSSTVFEFPIADVAIKEYDVLVSHNPRLEIKGDSTYVAIVPQGTVSNRHHTPVNEPDR